MIRRADFSDLHIVSELAHSIWPPTFKNILSPAQIDYMLNWMYTIDTLNNQLETGHEFYILEHKDMPIGFMGIEKIDQRLKIHKLYILPSMHGKGFGKKLIEKAMDRAKELSVNTLYLNVNRFNKAVDFYKHIGMKIVKEEDIDIGAGYLMEDYVFEMKLVH